MRVFVTGASGWIGSAVVPELIGAGHQVVGLARSEVSAAALTAAGAEAHRGTLDDLDILRSAAAEADGVIHLAFKHDIAFSGDFQGASDADRRAVETMGEALAGSGRPFVMASGTLGIAPGRIATEEDGRPDPAGARPNGAEQTRLATAQLALSFATDNIRSSVVRLPRPCTERGTPASWRRWSAWRAPTVSPAMSVRANRWSAAHRLDAAHLFRLAVEKAPAGSVLHAVADEDVPIRTVAEVIGRHLDLPVAAVAPEDAAGHFGWLAGFIAADSPASSALTRELMGWRPTHPALIEDLEKGHYFRNSDG